MHNGKTTRSTRDTSAPIFVMGSPVVPLLCEGADETFIAPRSDLSTFSFGAATVAVFVAAPAPDSLAR